MPHSQLIDSFCLEDEHFFRSYEAEPVDAEADLTLESAAAERPTTAQLAHLTRFHRPVAWFMAALGSLSLVALGQHAFHDARHEVVAQIRSAPAIRISSAEPTSDDLGSWTALAADAIALVFQSTPPRAPSELPARADAETARMQASQINDYTSELLSICREASS